MNIATRYELLRHDGSRLIVSISFPYKPSLVAIRDLITPLLGGRFERVSVLHESTRCDMFVLEDGHRRMLPRNEQATRVYRHNVLSRKPHVNPESLHWIAGPAVLFDRVIWD